MWLLENVIDSFNAKPCVGLPLGNLTSQLFVNIYLNEFDQFVKHKLKAKYYLRYCDDFVIFSENKVWLGKQIPAISEFLDKKLKLKLHPKKVSIEMLASGIDFLGWVNFSEHRILRTKTKRKMMKKLKENPKPESVASYLGLLSHGDMYKLSEKIRSMNIH